MDTAGLKKPLIALVIAVCACGCAASLRGPEPVSSTPVVTVRPQQGWGDAILYFVMTDRYADLDFSNDFQVDPRGKGTFHGGDLKGLTAQLDELADLGVTAIWVTPVVKNIDHYVDAVGFPDWAYHGYWADDFTTLDRRFCTEQDLLAFVQAAHARGIKVILDVVYNHAGYGSSYATRADADKWVRTGNVGNPCGDDDLTECVSGLPDFKTEDPNVADYLMNAHLGLAKRSGIDGFRLDTVKHVSHAFWQAHRRRIDQELGEEFFLLGEVWGGNEEVLDPWFETDELDAGFDFSFQGNVVGFVLGRGRTVAFSRYLQHRHRVRSNHLLAHFLSSHDVPGALFLLKGDKELYRLCVALQLTSIGIPVIYYGEEVGRLGGDWPDNRSDMPWGNRNILPGKGLPRDEAMRDYFRRLIGIRRSHPALQQGSYEELSAEGDLLVFARREGADSVVVAINRGSASSSLKIPLPQGWEKVEVHEALTGARVSVSGGMLDLSVPARMAHIYHVTKGAGVSQ